MKNGFKLRESRGEFFRCQSRPTRIFVALHGPLHGLFGLLSKAFLQSPRKRISQTCRGTRPGKCMKVVPHALVSSMEFHAKPFLAPLSMFRQSSIGEAEFFGISALVDFVNDAARVQGPKT